MVRRIRILGATLLILPMVASAQSKHSFISNGGTVIYLGAALALPVIQDGKLGWNHFLRTADSLVVSLALAEGLKGITRERRPYERSFDSFPSAHSTLAFAAATMQSEFHPREAPLWYAGAALIGYDRVQSGQHHIQDVVAGALLGYATSRLELASHKGILVRPLITGRGGYGFVCGQRF